MSNAIVPASASQTADALFSNATGSSSSSSTSSKAFDDLSAKIAAAQKQADLAKQQASISVQDFQKNTNDVQIDNRMTARNIGNLRENDSRLSVFSSLDKKDPADFFTFNVVTSADTKFSLLTANGADEASLRFQVIDSGGQVIADSSPDSGDAKAAYNQLIQGTLNLNAGKYVLRITRQDDTKTSQASTAYNYAIQLSQGLHARDFDTIEKAANKNADQFGFTANSAVNTLTSSIASSVSDLQNLPPIGTSATDKLLGVFTSLVS